VISESSINDVRDIPIQDIIEPYVQLKNAGSVLKGCCPFHDEKTGSFIVTPAKGFYKCFGCGASGDGIKFIMEKEGKTFAEAVELIASKNSITLQYEQGKTVTPEQKDFKQAVLRSLKTAAIRYAQKLHEKDSLDVYKYLDVYQYLVFNRGLKPQTINDWKIGFAPNDGKFLTDAVIKADYWKYAEAAGIVKSKDGYNYDFFRNRIIIPIEHTNGDVISLAGRKLVTDKSDSPKFINGINTDVYDKSRTLFGLSRAQRGIKEQGCAILTEGYHDVILPHQCGWTNVVATCGTALTEQHARLLSRYTDRIIIMRDGDKAGYKAIEKDIDILSRVFNDVKIIFLPEGEDPDSLFRKVETGIWWQTITETTDAFEWQCSQWLSAADKDDMVATAQAISDCVELLSRINLQLQREMYVTRLCKAHKIKEAQFKSAMKDKLIETTGSLLPEDELPKWVDVEKLYAEGFVMNYTKEKDRIGIYFKGDSKPVMRLTNYVVKPLYLIADPLNSRRLVEVFNGVRTSVVELPNKAFTSQENFETEIISKGNFYSEPGFSKPHYKRLVNWLTDNMVHVHELKTLGWQPEGFFAFANKIAVPGAAVNASVTLLSYDDYGIANVNNTGYLSPGVSKINADTRTEDNIYENDLYLKYADSPINFKQWAELFCDVYDEHAPFGIAFIFIAAFKDIITRVTKCPLPYFYGPKGSGKSAMAESMMWFFFSGRNGEGKLIQGYNLNPGQGTPFSFFSRLQRFRNVFMLYNEYDPNTVEFWKKGAFKSSYDGEGREVGSGDTGKKRKTEIQKVQCVPGIAGQYLDTTDDGSVMSRSIPFKFSLEKNKNRTDEQKAKWKQLNDYEMKGISSLAAQLYTYRNEVAKGLKEEFWKIESNLNIELRKKQIIAEARLLNNYSLCLSVIKIMQQHLPLPFTYQQFYQMAFARISEHAKLLKDNNVLSGFWNVIEVLFDDGHLKNLYHFRIETESLIKIKVGSETISKDVGGKEVLYIRMNALWDKYSKRYREQHNKTAPDIETLVVYLKDQPYFLGLAPVINFKDKKTSAYALDYDMLKLQGLNLEKYHDQALNQDHPPPTGYDPTKDPDRPF
jgi:DNA primase